LIVITLAKFRRKPTKEDIPKLPQYVQEAGGKVLSAYWTLGRYDAVVTIEAADEKAALKALLKFGDYVATETLVAISRDEAAKLL
jgi:uncharacterized protein with GYD domain